MTAATESTQTTAGRGIWIPAYVCGDAWPGAGVRELVLEAQAGHRLAEASPGSHVSVRHPNGVTREYSLLGGAEQTNQYRVAIKREAEGRGGSIAFHDALDIGEEVAVSAPVAGMTLDDTAEHHVFVAGGIGITAIIGLLNGLASASSAEVHYCVRSAESAPYLDDLRGFGAPVHVHDSSVGTRLDVGELIETCSPTTTLYFCGPPGLMSDISTATSSWPAARVRSETFTPAQDLAAEGGDEPFEVYVNGVGKTIQVCAEETMLSALRRSGVHVDSSCEAGQCGTCVLEYTEGDVLHRDSILDDDERTEMLTPCVSRARGRMAIDL